MSQEVKEFFQRIQLQPAIVSGHVTSVAIDKATGQQTSALVSVGAMAIQIRLGIGAPLLAYGDQVRLEQHGNAATAEYRLADASGARPGAGAFGVLNDNTPLGGGTYMGGDVIFGKLSGGNVFVQHDSGRLYHRIGEQVYGIEYPDGSQLFGHATLPNGGDWTPDGPNVWITPNSVQLRNTDVPSIDMDTDGTVWAKKKIVAGIDNNIGALDGADALWRIYAGDASPAAAPFRVDQAGNLVATEADIQGKVTAKSGAITGLLDVGPATGLRLQIDGTNKRLQSSDFVSGHSGFRLDTALAEFNNVRVRGVIQAAVFQKDAVSVVGGSVLVLDGDVLAADLDSTGTTITTRGQTTFAVNDYLRMKNGGQDEWLKVTAVGANHQYTVARDQAGLYTTDPTWETGTAIARYRQAADGGILLNASDGKPSLDIFTNGATPWLGTSLAMRQGYLNGAFGSAANQYGFGVGDYAAKNYLLYNPLDGFKVVAGSGGTSLDKDGLGLAPGGSFARGGGISWLNGATVIGRIWTHTGPAGGESHVRIEALDSLLGKNGVELRADEIILDGPVQLLHGVTGGLSTSLNGDGTAQWAFDASGGSNWSVAAGATVQPFGNANNFGGFFFLYDMYTGVAALCAYAGGQLGIIWQSYGGVVVLSSTPGVGQIGIWKNAGNILQLKNNQSQAALLRVCAFRIGGNA